MTLHVKGILCRGSRRWKDRKTTNKIPKDHAGANAGVQPEVIVGSGFVQGAPATRKERKPPSRFDNLPPDGLSHHDAGRL